MPELDKAVGPGAPNRPIDVGVVQDLLNLAMPGEPPLPWNGLADAALFERIGRFQQETLHRANSDRRIDPGGPTLRALRDLVPDGATAPWHQQGNPAWPGSGLADPAPFVARFTDLYRRQFDVLPAGLAQLAGSVLGDSAIGDIRWAAYMLATAEWETGHTCNPVREWGQGAGHAYGDPVTWQDTAGVSHTGVYYGRGYVQLTWLDNYRKIGKAIGQGDGLAITPDNALDAHTAYQVMSYGMIHGSFTGVGLARFIHDTTCDYRNARRIINALDQADHIAGMAAKIEMLLRLATR